jgi:hypothetical protein
MSLLRLVSIAILDLRLSSAQDKRINDLAPQVQKLRRKPGCLGEKPGCLGEKPGSFIPGSRIQGSAVL